MKTPATEIAPAIEFVASKTWVEFKRESEKRLKIFLIDLLQKASGNVSRAAVIGDMNRQNLIKKLKRQNIQPADYR